MSQTQLKLYTKIQIAAIQINRAIQVLCEDEDVVSAITLSGAADDIIWKLLEESGTKSHLTEIAENAAAMCEQISAKFNKNLFFEEIHQFRTELKHRATRFKSDTFAVPLESALEIIDRCCENHRRLTGSYPTKMPIFQNFLAK